MPMRPLQPCPAPGCNLLTTHGRCAAHLRAERQQFDAGRGTATARGYGPAHRQWRAAILARDPLCVRCGRKPSTVADHIVPLRDGGTWALSNGQGLDVDCHAVKTAEDVRRRKDGRAEGVCPSKTPGAIAGDRARRQARAAAKLEEKGPQGEGTR